MKFRIICLNPAVCKFCNILPQTLLLETAIGYSPFSKEPVGQAREPGDSAPEQLQWWPWDLCVSSTCYRADGNSYLFGSLATCRTLESCAVFWQAITRFI